MSAKSVVHLSSLVILPAFYGLNYALRVLTRGTSIDQWLPKWDTLLILGVIVLLERVYTYRYAMSQRGFLTRDILSSLVNLYVTGAVTAFLVLPLLLFFPEHLLGRKLVFVSPEQLGPLWLQVPMIVLFVSFFRYWFHRWSHQNEFLWKLHSVHHSVTDLQARNTLHSHPIDYALRNVVVFLVLGLFGFDPFAIFVAVPATQISGIVSHCGGDVKGGLLNYVFMTPEVHRWHHSAKVPEGHRFSCNYGVEFSFWDILFGTYYLPVKDGQTLQPERIGHPDGMQDEPNYLKLLLAPLGLYRPLKPQGQEPAE